MQASENVVATAGGTYESSLNLVDTGDAQMVATVQVDECVYAVGPDDYSVGRFSLAEWIGEAPPAGLPPIEADDAAEALAVLDLVREDAFLWQCGGCADGTRGWVYTSNRPRIGVLACSCCGREGGVDFFHADRHVGAPDKP